MEQKTKFRKKQRIAGIMAAAVMMAAFSVQTVVAAPRLNLFPRNVTEQLRSTGKAARAMESDLKGVIGELEKQMKLYEASGCENSDDPGCEAIASQINTKYGEMLDIMKQSLPEIKSSVEATHEGVEKNIRNELGKKFTPADIQRMLSSKTTPKVYNGRFSLSKRFAKYHKMIASNGQNNLATVAAEIYLDTSEVIRLIGLMEGEISRQSTIIELGNMYGTLTPEMTNTVSGVKTLIFGEPEAGGGLPEAMEKEKAGFESPLEIR